MEIRKCCTCQQELELSEKFFNKRLDTRYKNPKIIFHHECKKCRVTRKCAKEKANKAGWKQEYGGKCIRCGYSKCMAALEFHHRNSETKGYNIANFTKAYNPQTAWPENQAKVREELDKCDLVCANCHREIHFEE